MSAGSATRWHLPLKLSRLFINVTDGLYQHMRSARDLDSTLESEFQANFSTNQMVDGRAMEYSSVS
jgi:hypothetical protein